MSDDMGEIGFTHLLDAPADILGKPLTLLHWSGATEGITLKNMDEAVMVLGAGWTRYRLDQNGNGTEGKG